MVEPDPDLGADVVLEPEPDREVLEPKLDPTGVLGLEVELGVLELDGTAEVTVSDFGSLGVEGALSELSRPKDSFRFIQLVSVRVTFLYFAFPAADGTELATEFSGALTCVDLGGCVGLVGGTELDKGECTFSDVDSERACLESSDSELFLGTQLWGLGTLPATNFGTGMALELEELDWNTDGDTVLGLAVLRLALTRELDSSKGAGFIGGTKGGGVLLLELGSSLDKVKTALVLSVSLLASDLTSDLATGEMGLLVTSLTFDAVVVFSVVLPGSPLPPT